MVLLIQIHANERADVSLSVFYPGHKIQPIALKTLPACLQENGQGFQCQSLGASNS